MHHSQDTEYVPDKLPEVTTRDFCVDIISDVQRMNNILDE